MNLYQDFHSSKDSDNMNVTSINRKLSHSPWGAYLSKENRVVPGSYYLEFWIKLK